MTEMTQRFTARPTRRGLLAGGIALSAGAVLHGCGPQLGALLTATDGHPADYPTVRAVEFMGRFLAEQTGGRLGIKMFAGGQLGSETDTLEITSFGGIDINRVYFAPLNSIEPMTLPFSLPFVFDSVDHMRRVVDSPVGGEVLASLEPHGLIGLAIYDSGSRSFYNTKKPIKSPADMEGMKFRVMNNNLFVGMVDNLGGNATPMAYGEVYQSLKTGVIDGAENNYPSFESSNHYEVAKYYSITEHLIIPECVCIATTAWEGLSDADKDAVRAAAVKAAATQRELWAAREIASREKVEASGVTVNTVDDKMAFQNAMAPVYADFIQKNPTLEALINQIKATN